MRRSIALAASVLVGCLALASPPPVVGQAPLAAPAAVVPLTDAQQRLLAALLAAGTDADRDAAIAAAGADATAAVVAAALDAGLARRRGADTDGSNAAFQAARALAAALGLGRDEARAWMQLAQNASRQGRLDAASAALDAAERVSAAAGDTPTLAAIVGNRGIVARMRGDFDTAAQHYLEAVRLSEELAQPAMQASALNNLGNIHMQRGDYASALDALQRSQAIKPQNDLTKARTMGNLGVVYSAQGDYDLAIAAYERQIEMLTALGEHAEQGMPLLALGVTLRDAGRVDAALEVFARAEAIMRASQNTFDLQTLMLERGQAHLQAGHLREAEADFTAAVEQSRQIDDDKAGMATAHIMLAETRLALGQADAALTSARAGLDLARAIGSQIVVDDAWAIYGRVLARLGRHAEARVAFDASIDEIERQRATVAGDDASRSRFLADRLRTFHDAIDLFDRTGQPELAFAYADRARARGFVDVLTRGRVDLSAALTDEERREEQRLEQALADVQRAVTVPTVPGTLGADPPPASDAVSSARLALSEFRIRVAARHPRLRLATAAARPLRPADFASVVDAATVVAAFSVLPTRTRVTILSRGSAATPVASVTYDVAITHEQVERDVEAFRAGIASRDLAVSAQARRWYTQLFGRAPAAFARATRMVVVPDAHLWDLPFQALQDARGRYLVERMAITYAPSFAALQELNRAVTTAPAPGMAPRLALVAFGNPAPVAGGGAVLPEAANQVSAIARLYPASQVHVATEGAVTEAAVESWAPRARVLHLATHGLLDEASPMFSWLALSAEAPGATDDGRFEAREMLRLSLTADLVVLSACESARGAVTAGEGMIGLAWATLVAGARNVVVSQWKVDAAATERLMVAFHRRVASPTGTAPRVELASALRAASLDLLAAPETRHPFYWAGFALVGAGWMPAQPAR
ncbi:MAG: CHAT domain-containing protein [Acidobacteria bacterium]|nr:CHAT domain-containing protein [Acidobacteriota bacterium]